LQVDFLMVVIDASWGSSVAVVVVGFFFAGTVLLAMLLAPWLVKMDTDGERQGAAL
jgi:hypothetical protein